MYEAGEAKDGTLISIQGKSHGKMFYLLLELKYIISQEPIFNMVAHDSIAIEALILWIRLITVSVELKG